MKTIRKVILFVFSLVLGCMVYAHPGKCAPAGDVEPSVGASEPSGGTSKVLVSKWSYGGKSVKAGETFTVKATLHNTDRRMYVKNMTASIESDKEGIVHKDGTNTKYVGYIRAGRTKTVSFRFGSKKTLDAGQYKFTVNLEYESKDGTAGTTTATCYVNIKQDMKVQMEPVCDYHQVEDGDQIPISVNVMNLGHGTIYNARCLVKSKEVNSVETAFIGEMGGNTSNTCELQLMMDKQSTDLKARSECEVELKYEDENGKQYTKKSYLSFQIEPIKASGTVKKDQGPMQWWITVGVVAGVSVVVLIIWRICRRRRRYEE